MKTFAVRIFLFAVFLHPLARAEDPKPYPLKTCIVSDEVLEAHPIALVHEGREIKFCCRECRWEFKDDPAKFLKKLETAASEAR